MKWSLLLLLVAPWSSSCKKGGANHVAFDREKAAQKASTLAEKPATIHSKPKFSDDVGGTWLEAAEGDTFVIEYWGDKGQTPPAELDPKKTYQFDLIKQPYVADPDANEGEEFNWSASLVRILDSGQVIYDASICSLHKVQMKRGVVPFQYGLPLFREGFEVAKKTKFPNATPYVDGGCCVASDRTTRVFRCERCIQEQQVWDAAHPQTMTEGHLVK
ncbi:MAG TPA: hypothetical protein VGE67_14070 [Haloferula sp.]